MKDLVDIAEKIAAVLTSRKQTIAIAESSTGATRVASLHDHFQIARLNVKLRHGMLLVMCS